MATTTNQFRKDPQAILDYGVDWSEWLAAGETIASSGWVVDAGLTVVTISNTITSATVWLSGGTSGTTYAAVNRITTSQGRTNDRTIRIFVADT